VIVTVLSSSFGTTDSDETDVNRFTYLTVQPPVAIHCASPMYWCTRAIKDGTVASTLTELQKINWCKSSADTHKKSSTISELSTRACISQCERKCVAEMFPHKIDSNIYTQLTEVLYIYLKHLWIRKSLIVNSEKCGCEVPIQQRRKTLTKFVQNLCKKWPEFNSTNFFMISIYHRYGPLILLLSVLFVGQIFAHPGQNE